MSATKTKRATRIVPEPYITVGDRKFPYTAILDFNQRPQPDVMLPLLEELSDDHPIERLPLMPCVRALRTLASSIDKNHSTEIQVTGLMLVNRPCITLPAGPFSVRVPAGNSWYDFEFSPTRASREALVGVAAVNGQQRLSELPSGVIKFREIVAYFFEKSSLNFTLSAIQQRMRDHFNTDISHLMDRWLFAYCATPLPAESLIALGIDGDMDRFMYDLESAEAQILDFAGLRQSLRQELNWHMQHIADRYPQLLDLYNGGLIGSHIFSFMEKSAVPEQDADTLHIAATNACKHLGL